MIQSLQMMINRLLSHRKHRRQVQGMRDPEGVSGSSRDGHAEAEAKGEVKERMMLKLGPRQRQMQSLRETVLTARKPVCLAWSRGKSWTLRARMCIFTEGMAMIILWIMRNGSVCFIDSSTSHLTTASRRLGMVAHVGSFLG